MDLQPIAQNLLYGLFLGGLYGMAAVGLSLVFGVLKVLNVAHGALLMLGGYVAFWLFDSYGIDPLLAIPLVAAMLFAVGLGLHVGLFQFVTHLQEEARIKNSLLIAFGLTLILENLALRLWTADERAVTTSYAGEGFKLAGVAGTLVTLVDTIAPSVGLEWTLKALVVVVLAGLGSILGAFGAGLLLGEAEAVSIYIFDSSNYREIVGLILFLIVLLLRPQGLFGRR